MDTSTSTTNMEIGMVLQLLFNFGSAALPLKNDDKSTTTLHPSPVISGIHWNRSLGSIFHFHDYHDYGRKGKHPMAQKPTTPPTLWTAHGVSHLPCQPLESLLHGIHVVVQGTYAILKGVVMMQHHRLQVWEITKYKSGHHAAWNCIDFIGIYLHHPALQENYM